MGNQVRFKHALVELIVGTMARRHSTAVVLFHQAVAGRLGLGATDHKCLDVVRERGTMTGSELAAITGVTTGAITGVVARLEHAGFVRWEPDPQDGRQQIISPVQDRIGDIKEVIAPIRQEVATMLASFDAHQLAAIAEFLARTSDIAYQQIALLRAQKPSARERPGRGKPLKTPPAGRGKVLP